MLNPDVFIFIPKVMHKSNHVVLCIQKQISTDFLLFVILKCRHWINISKLHQTRMLFVICTKITAASTSRGII